LPLDLIYEYGGASKIIRFARIGKLYRLLKLAKMLRLLETARLKNKYLAALVRLLGLGIGFERLIQLLISFILL